MTELAKRVMIAGTRRIKGIYWRAVPSAYAETVLESGPNFFHSSRYSIASEFSGLYFSSSVDICKKELTNKLGEEGESTKIIGFEVNIEDIIDLTDSKTRDELHVDLEEIALPKHHREAYKHTHRIARLVYKARLSGILAPSTHDPYSKEWNNLIIFPANIVRGVMEEISKS